MTSQSTENLSVLPLLNNLHSQSIVRAIPRLADPGPHRLPRGHGRSSAAFSYCASLSTPKQRPAAGCSGPKGLPTSAVQPCGGHFERLSVSGPSVLREASVDPGDVGQLALDTFELAGRGRLAGLEVDRIERAAGHEPR